MEKTALRLSKEKIYSVKTKMLNQQPPQRQAQLMTLHACLSYSASLRHFSCMGLSLPPYTQWSSAMISEQLGAARQNVSSTNVSRILSERVLRAEDFREIESEYPPERETVR